MLRMSKLADYGTVVMTYLAQEPERVRSALEIATAIRLELPTVSKVLKALARGKLLQSQRGAQGGYVLVRAPEKISVAEIIDVLEGYPMGLTECSSIPGLCVREAACSIRTNWQRISQAVRASLERVTLAELAHPFPPVIGRRAMRRHEASIKR